MKVRAQFALLAIWGLLSVLLFSNAGAQTLIINEVSNGANGNKEFVEFVVADENLSFDCSNNAPPCIDIRGWIFDDNSGYHGSGGIANGALRFSYDPLWACVPVGTIILVYNDADPGLSVPPDDLNLADGNCRIVAPISDSFLFEHNFTTPGAASCSYPSSGWIAGGDWTFTFLANSGDCARLVDLSGCEVFSVCWASCSNNTLIYFDSFGSGSQKVWYFNGGDPNNQANWSEGSASSGGDETPGLPNNAANAAYIGQFNNNCVPVTALQVNGSSTDSQCGACSGTASVLASGSIPGYTYNWTASNYSSLGIQTATATGLCSGNYHCIVSSSIGCSDTVDVTVLDDGSGFSSTELMDVCQGITVTYPDGTLEVVTANTSHISTLISSSGCDSIVTTNVSVVSGFTSSENVDVCSGTTVVYPDGTSELISANTSHVSALTSSSGCDSTVTTNVSIVAGFTSSETVDVCAGTIVFYPDGTSELIVLSTSHVSALITSAGCDSTVTTNVSVVAGFISTENMNVCAGATVVYPDGTSEVIAASTVHISALITNAGCDSVVTTNVSVVAGFTTTENLNVCGGTTVVYPDGTSELITANTSHISALTSSAGCDSIITTNVSLSTGFMGNENLTVCAGTTVTYPDGSTETVLTNTNHTSIWPNGSGCDSVVVTQVTVNQSTLSRTSFDLCLGSDYTFPDGTVLDSLTQEISHTSTLTSTNGCDSILVITLRPTAQLVPAFTFDPQKPTTDLNTVTFQALSPDGIRNWTIVDETGMLLMESVEDSFDITLPNDLPHTFHVCLEVNADGCVGQTCDSLILKPDLTVYIPNAFTPHMPGQENGINDVFLPIISGAFVHSYTLHIYNRWGEEIFTSTDPKQGWDGYFKGALTDQAVYAYSLSFSVVPLTFVHQYTGHVTVVR
ncbi:MAG: gliding motility-associated C-terminal domain-containing protein [Flavobacteriales bacterium]|nr:gliding motility-associated C-terminal domain-containing protein [Flavobacteriales bacterium]